MMYSMLISYKNANERLFYEGIDNQLSKEKEMNRQWKLKHPFQPNTEAKRSKSKKFPIERMMPDRSKVTETRLKQHYKNNYDEKTGQRLFEPKINPYNEEVFREAYRNRYNSELNEKAKQMDKKIKKVFYFLSLNQDTIRVKNLDCLHIKNEFIVLFRDIMIEIIRGEDNLSYDDFIDFVLENEFLDDIERACEYIDKKDRSKPRKKSRNKPYKRQDYDTIVNKLAKQEMGEKQRQQRSKSPSFKPTKNYAKLIK